MMAIFLRSVRSVSINLQVPIHEKRGLFHKKTSANQADVVLQEYNPIRLERFWIEASGNWQGLGKISSLRPWSPDHGQANIHVIM
jgi:hypothetical protein